MKFGITQAFDCSYLAQKQEQLLVYVPDDDAPLRHDYQRLIAAGFRRSGDQVYRPHCADCQACQSIRIPVADFIPSKSQKRILAKNRDIRIVTSDRDKPDYYPLYEQYINLRHADGSMYPPSRQQYDSFVHCDWLPPLFIEMHLNDTLVGVAITDHLADSYSAMYTFFSPELDSRSLGMFGILQQIALAQKNNKEYLYLGYQIDSCSKMNYKAKFLPHQRFLGDKWQLITKKSV